MAASFVGRALGSGVSEKRGFLQRLRQRGLRQRLGLLHRGLGGSRIQLQGLARLGQEGTFDLADAAVGLADTDRHLVGQPAGIVVLQPGGHVLHASALHQYVLIERRQIDLLAGGQALGDAPDLLAFAFMFLPVRVGSQQAQRQGRADLFGVRHGGDPSFVWSEWACGPGPVGQCLLA